MKFSASFHVAFYFRNNVACTKTKSPLIIEFFAAKNYMLKEYAKAITKASSISMLQGKTPN